MAKTTAATLPSGPATSAAVAVATAAKAASGAATSDSPPSTPRRNNRRAKTTSPKDAAAAAEPRASSDAHAASRVRHPPAARSSSSSLSSSSSSVLTLLLGVAIGFGLSSTLQDPQGLLVPALSMIGFLTPPSTFAPQSTLNNTTIPTTNTTSPDASSSSSDASSSPAPASHGGSTTTTGGPRTLDSLPPERKAYIDGLVQSLEIRERREMFQKIYEQNAWQDAESASGPGSSLKATQNVRLLIETVLSTFNVTTLIDSPCGDVNWQHLIPGLDRVSYLGLDIVPSLIEANAARFAAAGKSNMSFAAVDFSAEPYPLSGADVVVNRDMIQHNTLAAGVRAYANVEASGAKYLVTTWHHHSYTDAALDGEYNYNVGAGGWYPVDVFLHPFNFSRPLFWIEDGSMGDLKMVGVWELPALGMGDGTRFRISALDWKKGESEVVYYEGDAAADDEVAFVFVGPKAVTETQNDEDLDDYEVKEPSWDDLTVAGLAPVTFVP
ncbi:hypothetical protein DFJ73DRAFT_116535 [Zopfochytrium polystomum]|nr:hypothetical protein DFJ73DRAFT_116535 [Zopfochytrium polystomum]